MKVLQLLVLAALALPIRAGFVSAQEPGFSAVASGCVDETRETCLGNVQNVLVALRGNVSQGLLDESLGRLVLAMVNALEESFSDDVFVTVAMALREIARFAVLPEFSSAILEIAAIIEQRDIFVIAPDLLIASPS
ncbi:MAG: hypothetical protein L3J33_01255 [Rhodobacteraceae bacterium]|nr:hypothetical protein [Paracoccaceae bacterium]